MNFNVRDEDIIKKNPHFERLLDEHFELKDKFTKLETFINGSVFSKLPVEESDLLKEQLSIMEKYLEILNKRIEYIRSNY